MTRRSAAFHRGCHRNRGSKHQAHGFRMIESATKTLLRLLTCGDPAGGVSETQFCSLFSMCPRCLIFMTWDAARFHVCSECIMLLDGEGNESEVSDFEGQESD